MKLDLPSLTFLQGLTTLAQVLALAIQFRTSRAYRGTGWWLAGAASFATGFICLGLNALFRLWPLGILGNPALLFAHAAFLLGTRRFLDLPNRRGRILLVLAAMIATYDVFLFLIPSIYARTAVVSTSIALFDMLTAVAFLGSHGRRLAQPARFCAAAFALHSCFLLGVAGSTLANPAIRSYHEYSLLQTLAFVMPGLTSTLWTFGFILLLNRRLDVDRQESVAEWRRAEKEKTGLELRNRQLEKADSLARMAGAIAHHYNNRLQVVLSSLELAETAPQGPAFDGAMAKAKHATERAAEMSRLMLVYLGHASHDQRPQDLSALCQSHLGAMRSSIPPRIQLRTDLPSPGPAIRANASQVQELLANLTRNALEAMEASGSEIRISTGVGPASAIPSANRFPVGWDPQDQDHAWVEVADNGAGVAPADMDKLFDPFFSTKFTGRGLGLSVVLGIAQAHGGGMTVESHPGQGSAFRVHFPVAGEAAQAADPR
jgi:signal transduction histidine kinase